MPRSIGKLKIMWIGNVSEKYLAHHTEYIDSCDNNGGAGNDRSYKVSAFSNEPTKIVISAMKPEKPGSPRLASPAIT